MKERKLRHKSVREALKNPDRVYLDPKYDDGSMIYEKQDGDFLLRVYVIKGTIKTITVNKL